MIGDLFIYLFSSWYAEKEATEEILKVTRPKSRGASGNWFIGRDDKMVSYPYGSEAAIYKGNAYNTFSRKFLEWFFEDEKCQAPFELASKKGFDINRSNPLYGSMGRHEGVRKSKSRVSYGAL